MAEREAKDQTVAAAAFAVFAVVCLSAFLAYRGADIGKLWALAGNLGGGPLFGFEGLRDSVVGAIAAVLIGVSWFGIGSFILSFIRISTSEEQSHIFEFATKTTVGAAFWSLIWFFFGLAGAYSGVVAIASAVIGVVLAALSYKRVREAKDESRVPEKAAGFDKALLGLIVIPLGLAFIVSLAPPTAKDTLLYHFSVPKAFVAQAGNAFIEGNIASYLALGTEMHTVWAMLLGGFINLRAAEVAAGVTVFLFFPLLLAAIFGWSREIGISRRWSLITVLIVASVPTVFHVASSGYIDIALALFVTLAIYGLTRWWKEQTTDWVALIAIFLGAALSIKLTTVFVIAAFALLVLLRARGNPVAIAPGSDPSGNVENTGKIIASGVAALVLAGAIASPWYLRTWKATGSPVFPFYMSIWKGEATGWDVERSNLFQGMNSQYGGAATNPINYLTAPLRVSLAAQPEDSPLYDGVLGPMFLIGLPLLIWAFWKREIAVEAKIAAGVAGVMFLFWLFSSQQLRYLLPIVPALAVAIAASIEALSRQGDSLNKAAKYSLIAASLVCIGTSFAWFCQKAPLRVVLGGETRGQYLTRNLDHYPYYQAINNDTAVDAKVWLINMRRDTYHIERPVFSDYMFEDWTFGRVVKDSENYLDVRRTAKDMGFNYVLVRHDILLDYKQSAILADEIGNEEKRLEIAKENARRIKIAREFVLDPANTIRADNKFSLIKVF